MEVKMKSVAIVSLNCLLAKTIAKKLSEELNCTYIDLGVELEKVLILNIRAPILDHSTLENRERELIRLSAQQKNAIIAVPNDVFLSNKNYELLKNLEIVLIEQDLNDKIKINLQNLIKKHSTISIKGKELNKLITFLKG